MGGVDLAHLKYFPIYLRYARTLRSLRLDQLGLVLLAGIQYAEHGTLPEMDSEVTVAMGFICEDIDQAQLSYDETCETNRRNANQRWKPSVDAVASDGMRSHAVASDGSQCNVSECKEEKEYNEHSMHADGQPVDSPGRGPSLEEVRSFVRQSGLNVDPDDYHEKRVRSGWRNKNGRYVGGDWQSDVRRWARYQKEPVKARTEPSKPMDPSFDTGEFFDAAVRASYAKYGFDVDADSEEGET